MSIKSIMILFFLMIVVTSCYVYEKISSRYASTYTPENYQFNIDSVYLEKNGLEMVNWCIDKGTADNWIVDTITYCTFYLRQERIKIPIVPFVFGLRFDKRKSSYSLDIKIHDVKSRYKNLDSISYKLYDNSQNILTEGIYSYKGSKGLNSDLLLENSGYIKYMPSALDINPKLEPTDTIIFADIELYFTDLNNRLDTWSESGIEFRYRELKRLTADMNW